MTALAVLATAGLMSACGSASPARTTPSPATAGSSAPSSSPAALPMIRMVRLGSAFSPDSLHLGAGQQFLVIVSKAVNVSGLEARCAPGKTYPAAGGLLSVRCPAAGEYLYTARRAGSAVLSATARPRCAHGTACPQWISRASLKVSIAQ